MKMNFMNNKIYQSDIEQIADFPIRWSDFAGKTILLTGASGMIASVLIDVFMKRNARLESDELGVNLIAVSRNEEKAKKKVW